MNLFLYFIWWMCRRKSDNLPNIFKPITHSAIWSWFMIVFVGFWSPKTNVSMWTRHTRIFWHLPIAANVSFQFAIDKSAINYDRTWLHLDFAVIQNPILWFLVHLLRLRLMLQDNTPKTFISNSPEPFTSKGIEFTATISPGMGSRDGLSCTEILLYTSVEIIEVIAPVSINISALTLFTLTGKYKPASTTRFETCLMIGLWPLFFRSRLFPLNSSTNSIYECMTTRYRFTVLSNSLSAGNSSGCVQSVCTCNT